MERIRSILSISAENPMVIPASLSSVIYTQYILLILFFIDAGTKLETMFSYGVSYSKKRVSYSEFAVRQTNTDEKVSILSFLSYRKRNVKTER